MTEDEYVKGVAARMAETARADADKQRHIKRWPAIAEYARRLDAPDDIDRAYYLDGEGDA